MREVHFINLCQSTRNSIKYQSISEEKIDPNSPDEKFGPKNYPFLVILAYSYISQRYLQE